MIFFYLFHLACLIYYYLFLCLIQLDSNNFFLIESTYFLSHCMQQAGTTDLKIKGTKVINPFKMS